MGGASVAAGFEALGFENECLGLYERRLPCRCLRPSSRISSLIHPSFATSVARVFLQEAGFGLVRMDVAPYSTLSRTTFANLALLCMPWDWMPRRAALVKRMLSSCFFRIIIWTM